MAGTKRMHPMRRGRNTSWKGRSVGIRKEGTQYVMAETKGTYPNRSGRNTSWKGRSVGIQREGDAIS